MGSVTDVKRSAERSETVRRGATEDSLIYRWRGADISNILDFERDFLYRTRKVIRSNKYYRSTKDLLAAAGGVIANKHERKSKASWTEKKRGEQPSPTLPGW